MEKLKFGSAFMIKFNHICLDDNTHYIVILQFSKLYLKVVQPYVLPNIICISYCLAKIAKQCFGERVKFATTSLKPITYMGGGLHTSISLLCLCLTLNIGSFLKIIEG
jgi:hypothetical protein